MLDAANEDSFTSAEVSFHHVGALGHRREHPFLRAASSARPGLRIPLFPEQPVAGSGALFVGLAGAAPGDSVNLLLQLLEGSADAEAATPTCGTGRCCATTIGEPSAPATSPSTPRTTCCAAASCSCRSAERDAARPRHHARWPRVASRLDHEPQRCRLPRARRAVQRHRGRTRQRGQRSVAPEPTAAGRQHHAARDDGRGDQGSQPLLASVALRLSNRDRSARASPSGCATRTVRSRSGISRAHRSRGVSRHPSCQVHPPLAARSVADAGVTSRS